MLEDYVTASNLIRKKDLQGATEASLLIGVNATIAMLVHIDGTDEQRASTVEGWMTREISIEVPLIFI